MSQWSRESIPVGPLPSPSLTNNEPAMIVFSSPTRILHMNGQARSLIGLFGEWRDLQTLPADEAMPHALSEFCHDVLQHLRTRIDVQDWAGFELRRVCHMVTPPVLLRGFGVPDSDNHHPRIVLTLQSL